MTHYLKNNKYNKIELFLIFIIFSFFIYLRFQNLKNARFVLEDSYNLSGKINLSVPLLNLIYFYSFKIFGYYHHVVFYINSVIALLHIILTYLISSLFWKKESGYYAGLFLCSSTLHLSYSRLGTPAILQTLWILSGFYILSKYISKPYKDNLLLIFCSGIIFGISALCYVPSYAAIIAVSIICLTIFKKKLQIKSFFIFNTGVTLPLLITEIIFQFHKLSYFSRLLSYQKYAEKTTTLHLILIPISLIERIWHLGGSVPLLFFTVTFIFAIKSLTNKKNTQLKMTSLFIIIVFLVYSISGSLGLHPLYTRHYIMIIPFISILFSNLLHSSFLFQKSIYRIIFLCLFFIFYFKKAELIINQTFKIEEITKWLQKQQISSNQIVTNLNLNLKNSLIRSKNIIPGKPLIDKKKFLIDWNQLELLYKKRGKTHILTSGIGDSYLIGLSDIRLKQIKPVMTWKYPYKILNKTENFCNFKLYKIKALFDE